MPESRSESLVRNLSPQLRRLKTLAIPVGARLTGVRNGRVPQSGRRVLVQTAGGKEPGKLSEREVGSRRTAIRAASSARLLNLIQRRSVNSVSIPRMPLIIILVLVLLLFGGGGYYMGPGLGYYGGGGISLVLLIVILFLVFGRGRGRL